MSAFAGETILKRNVVGSADTTVIPIELCMLCPVLFPLHSTTFVKNLAILMELQSPLNGNDNACRSEGTVVLAFSKMCGI